MCLPFHHLFALNITITTVAHTPHTKNGRFASEIIAFPSPHNSYFNWYFPNQPCMDFSRFSLIQAIAIKLGEVVVRWFSANQMPTIIPGRKSDKPEKHVIFNTSIKICYAILYFEVTVLDLLTLMQLDQISIDHKCIRRCNAESG